MTRWAPRLTFNKRFWVGCAIALLSFSFLVVTLLQMRDARSLARDGISVQATVIDQHIIDHPTSDTGSMNFYLKYTFTLHGPRLTHERSVPENFFDTHPIGTVWDITVHPDDPSRHDLYIGQTRATAWGSLIASLFLAVFGTTLALSGGNLAGIKNRFKP